MKKLKSKFSVFGLLAVAGTLFFISCADNSSSANTTSVVAGDPVKTEKINLMKDVIDAKINFVNFDPAEHDSFTPQEWISLNQNLTESIKVTWPDGQYTYGLSEHTDKLEAMFVYAPDTRITVHPMRFASQEKTAVAGILTGTFTKPMHVGKGKILRPNGKSFSIPFYAIGFWENGKMVEKYFIWDDESYKEQLGIS